MDSPSEKAAAATCCGEGSELDAVGHEIWRATTTALVDRFHDSATYGLERQQVEGAIIELISEYLWHDLGTHAAWDAFDVQRWREAVLTLDDGYRRRVSSTLREFYDYLASKGRVPVASAARIKAEIEQCLADTATSVAPPRYSFTRSIGEDDEQAAPDPIKRPA